jgi:ADP-heptose:LPS heptosyltransferase
MELPAEPYLIFFPGASAGSKRWPPSYFAALADLLQPSGTRIILAGAQSDKEFAQTIIAGSRFPETILNLTGKTSLPQLLYLIKHARLLVSNDTSAAHMAAMFQTPLVALCNGNKFGRFFPYPSGFRLVTSLHPVSGIPFHFEDRYPIKRISAQRAAQACFSLLK